MKENLLRTILRKSGYKVTPPRLAILSLFKKNKNPLSAQEVFSGLSLSCDQATVYRTIKSLATKGLIRQIDLRHNHAHYELVDVHEHHHLICTHCGRVEDVNGCGVEDMQGLVLRHAKHFTEIKQHSLEFYGVCKSCAKKLSN